MKPLSEVAAGLLVIQIQIQAVCHPSMLNATLKIVLTSLCMATILGLEIAQSYTFYIHGHYGINIKVRWYIIKSFVI